MLRTDSKRDDLLTEFGKRTLQDRYLLPGESYQELFSRVSRHYADDEGHAQRMYDYISTQWFNPATPVLSNGGTDRGLPISCFLNDVDDSMIGIAKKWDENVWLGAGGGGIGTCWSGVRSIGEPVRGRGGSSGIIPFIRVMDSLTLAVSQGSLRRGSGAAYLDISHPEVEEFLEIRKPTGDFNRKSLNLHHGLLVSDDFMKCLEQNGSWKLIDPCSKKVRKEVSARELFVKVLETRMATGEPYIVFSDNVNRNIAPHHKLLGLSVKQSNLCSEIMLPTGVDHLGKDRTAVCCLGSLNLAKYDEWKGNYDFIEDCLRFLDNVLQDFIDRTEGIPGYESARYSAMQERSVGLGVMGFHSYLQDHGLPFESPMTKGLNIGMFNFIREACDAANVKLGIEKGACPDSIEANKRDANIQLVRMSYTNAIAPTASISIICGGVSPCVEPWNTNCFTQKTLSGFMEVRNPSLERLLESLGKNEEEVWHSILEHEGSVQHLEFLDEWQKQVFKTSWELDNRWIVELAGDRSQFIDQGQSINLFLRGTIDKWDLLMLHYTAWKKGLKSLYYLRSMSVQRAGFAGVEGDNKIERDHVFGSVIKTDYEECLSCQ